MMGNIENLLTDARRLLDIAAAQHGNVVDATVAAAGQTVTVQLFSPAARRSVWLTFTAAGLRVDTFAGDRGVATRRLSAREVTAANVRTELQAATDWVNAGLRTPAGAWDDRVMHKLVKGHPLC